MKTVTWKFIVADEYNEQGLDAIIWDMLDRESMTEIMGIGREAHDSTNAEVQTGLEVLESNEYLDEEIQDWLEVSKLPHSSTG